MTTAIEQPSGLLPGPDPVRLVAADGSPVPAAGRAGPEMPDGPRQLALYHGLVLARRLNEHATAMAKQGMLAVYPSSLGQEACQVGAALALGSDDWLFPTYRDTAALVVRGIDPVEALALMRGDRHCGYDPVAHRTAPQCTPLATHCLHAVGLAQAAMLARDDVVALALLGDGATSEGDFHEALNFAAVFRAPVVFLVQNNRFAISVPLHRQTAAPTLAHKAVGYGMPGRRVDGNDVFAVSAVLDEAIRAARAGGGPTLIEAVTYRVGPHTNADDPSRYRTAAEATRWRGRDPHERAAVYLGRTGLLTDAVVAQAESRALTAVTRLREQLSEPPTVDLAGLHHSVYAEPPPHVREQIARRTAHGAGGRA